jgi:hypothetical protein
MLNTSIKVIATQYIDDHGWSQICEKKKSAVHPISTKRTPTYHRRGHDRTLVGFTTTCEILSPLTL